MKKHGLKFEQIQRIATKMMAYFEDLTYEEKSRERHLTTLKKKEEEIDRKYLMRRKIKTRYLRGHKTHLNKKKTP